MASHALRHLPQTHLPEACLSARIGSAIWHVNLAPGATARLIADYPDCNEDKLSPIAVLRVMQALRVKAVSLHFYGGGVVSLDESELGPRIVDTEDRESETVRWFDIIGVTNHHAVEQRSLYRVC